MSSLVALGRKTVTGLLRASGQQFVDWSGAYRFFSQRRFDPDVLFDALRKGVLTHFPEGSPVVCSLDDTIIRKQGRRIPGVGYRRDPLSPPFHTNLVLGQRFIQISASVPDKKAAAPSRAIPIDFVHAPSVKKPGKKATSKQREEYRQQVKTQNLSVQGLHRITHLRQRLDRDCFHKQLWLTVDGSFTNRHVLKGLPERTVLIGRIRKDAKLYFSPVSNQDTGRGRTRVYGSRAPTPEELRKDAQVDWQTVKVFAAGKFHNLKFKSLAPLRSPMTGQQHTLRLIVIAPLAYRLRKGGSLLYRKPAYLICTDPDADIQQVIHAYISRWDIEVNFRDEKTLLGVGQAQVWSEESVHTAPAFCVAAYSMLLLSAINAFGVNGRSDLLPPPKWYRKTSNQRATTSDLINHLRGELYGQALGNLKDFVSRQKGDMKQDKFQPVMDSALLYAVR